MKLSEINPLSLLGSSIIGFAEFGGDGVLFSGHTHSGHNNPDDIHFDWEIVSLKQWKALKKKLQPICNFGVIEMIGSGENEPVVNWAKVKLCDTVFQETEKPRIKQLKALVKKWES